ASVRSFYDWSKPRRSDSRDDADGDDERPADTDVGNAVRLVRQNLDRIRFNYSSGKWLIYDHRRWRLDDQGAIVTRAKATAEKICRANYDPLAQAPVFAAFMERIFRTHPALIPFVQKALGYSLTGDIGEQVLFFLYGKGANGKTTLLDAVNWVINDYAGKADP